MTTNPGGQEHVNAARTPEARIRLLLELTDHPNLGDEITYDRRFNTEAWPRNGYVLQRTDLEAVLAELDRCRGQIKERGDEIERLTNELEESGD